jgi:hypothetical protein
LAAGDPAPPPLISAPIKTLEQMSNAAYLIIPS